MVLTQILSHFPAGVHTLVLVSDPDGVLADEEVLSALAERGFTLVNEPDPVRLRHRVEQTRPFCADRQAAANVQDAFAQTILWSQDGLLPENVWVLMPQGRQAFAPADEIVVNHGGPTLDEMVVPLVTITWGS